MPAMSATYDPAVRAHYIRLCDTDVARTIELGPGVMVDVDEGGYPVGVEVLERGMEPVHPERLVHYPDI